MDSLHSEVVVSPLTNTPPPPRRAKSPPLAFAPTSNDALAPLISPSHACYGRNPLRSPTQSSNMGALSPPASLPGLDLQVIVDQQANAIQLIHEAFAAERQVWSLEKERLFQRIASLEQLLKNRDHYSPAKSPNMSPNNGEAPADMGITSPPARALSNTSRLPAISEDDCITPLSQRRDGAPRSIYLPGRPPVPVSNGFVDGRPKRANSVSFDDEGLMVEEILISPPATARTLSPPPPGNRAMAGHTPLKAPRPATPPPERLATDGMEDTPTRHNTHLNNFLTRSKHEDMDVALKGPLNLPELPHKPDESNFTLDALSARLEHVARSPDESRPTIFAQPSPGMISPTKPTVAAVAGPLADAPSPSSASATVSPGAAPLAPAPSNEMVNGVRLKKKASTNFGAPFGQLGGFGGRKLS